MPEIDRIPQAWHEWWEERAAILEYEAGFSRATAEQDATRVLQAFLTRVTQETTHGPR